MLGIAFWIGLFWKRYNAIGAWVSTASGFIVWWLTLQPGVVHWIAIFAICETLGMIEHTV
jgi:Na+/proline symporter